jgi:hypothetical protein
MRVHIFITVLVSIAALLALTVRGADFTSSFGESVQEGVLGMLLAW